jgi:replicative DNA helicase
LGFVPLPSLFLEYEAQHTTLEFLQKNEFNNKNHTYIYKIISIISILTYHILLP